MPKPSVYPIASAFKNATSSRLAYDPAIPENVHEYSAFIATRHSNNIQNLNHR